MQELKIVERETHILKDTVMEIREEEKGIQREREGNK